MSKILWVKNTLPATDDIYLSMMEEEKIKGPLAFHGSMPGYQPTPLAGLKNMARKLGLGGIWVKDESFRFGLNAFKVLGSSWAMACHIAGKLGEDEKNMTFARLTSPEIKEKLGDITFYTATDGNHGRGVAWAAARLGQKAVVHMPEGTVKSRVDNIAKEGARVTVEPMGYDDCVALAAREAENDPRGVLMQDTAWPGYEEIPGRITQGYGTMAHEAAMQMDAPPTHIFLQAGVGSMAAGVAGYFVNRYKDNPPRIIVVESDKAHCLYLSAAAGDGQPRKAQGRMDTIMAGLACGIPSTIAWDLLKNHASFFVACGDEITRQGMKDLYHPEGDDPRVISGESGAVGTGLIKAIMTDEENAPLKKALGLDENSRVLLFSTEGDTDPENYRKVVEE